MNNARANGFAIVSTVLVLCVVIVVLAAATSLRLVNQLGQETEIRAQGDAQRLAEGCMETAMQRLRADASYDGNEVVSVGSDACTIRPVLTGATTTIQTEATVDGHPYRIEVELDDVDAMSIASWAHVTAF